MKLSELFDLREKVETRVNQYWTYWSVSIFAVCGWIFTGTAQDSLNKETAPLIATGLLVFFISNLVVLKNATEFVMSVESEIALRSTESEFKSEQFKRILLKRDTKLRLLLTIFLHLVVDLVLLCAVFISGFS
ncbi:hypothetical protein OFY17_08295 [Marinomonas sp. C2222]|uniref:Uncharacterized protein n=1 Tax=Marinomonas sargassi TaxID=2984494 RepID=A0ABT2YSM2_9GAMM|nr:hypothetical protein [Marinomonas sargassi]MCV2402877.1 hypothetical protein [Marinomonas sargassi]